MAASVPETQVDLAECTQAAHLDEDLQLAAADSADVPDEPAAKDALENTGEDAADVPEQATAAEKKKGLTAKEKQKQTLAKAKAKSKGQGCPSGLLQEGRWQSQEGR